MRKTVFAVMMVFGVALLFAGAALAHFPVGVTYFAFQFPDALVPTFDGDLSDWGVVDESFRIPTEALKETQEAGKTVDLRDFASLIMFGWNASENKFYIGIETFDDKHIIREGDPGLDRVEVMVDADHSGGQFKGFSKDALGEEQWNLQEGGQAQQFGFSYPPANIHNWGGGPDGAQWVLQPPHARIGLDFEGVQPDGEGTNTYEIAMTLWDYVHYQGPDQSQEHSLQEGETIGLEVDILDPDQTENMFENMWRTSGQGGTFMQGDNLSDVFLSPITVTAVEPTSWGRIKSSFTQ
jgi:hypothetical protein